MQEELENDDSGLVLLDMSRQASKPDEKRCKGEGKKKDDTFDFWKEMLSLIGTIAVAATVVFLLKEFVIINAYIPSGSMEHTIQPGDRLIGNRLAYVVREPERGDIVIFRWPDNEKELFVKRIIGLPGETITIEDAMIYVDGVLLEEDYLKEEWIVDNGPYTFEIPEDSYLVLGDNRNNSKDARYWNNTYVKEDKILGKAVFRYWPFRGIGLLE